eukprot:CAMPEP_0197589268 /NCGR_PEP_ID=MMETSP1326-20131121/10273_1 /TAXON_ID=1155430 /ORGANISM="Genus nov. species nov., Strain RCC2288" /LENGTH=187 /DNA_ID=CAMNT_0043154185 /DNA_START=13 /DNA_END=576 /DNA_ORIENTATION=-
MSLTIASLCPGALSAAPSKAASLRSSRRCTAALRSAARSPTATTLGRRGAVKTSAMVDASIAYAVAQQDLFFAVLVGAECAYQLGSLPSDYPGRPSLPNIVLPCGLLVGSFALIQTDQDIITQGGLVLGAVACVIAAKVFLDRFDAIKDDGMDWPGPRIYPGSGMILSLFAMLANVEALPRILKALE